MKQTKEEYLVPEVETLFVDELKAICQTSIDGVSIEDLNYEDWITN